MNSKMYEESWWLMSSSFPELNWARLRVLLSGKAEVLDMDGHHHVFRNLAEAKNWLLEDELVSIASLDSEDEVEYEIKLSKIAPPKASSDAELIKLMYVPANA